MRCPFSAPEFVGVLRGRMVAVPVRTALHRAVVPEKQDASCAELEGQFDRSEPTVVLAVGFVPVQIVLSHCLARTAPPFRYMGNPMDVHIPPSEITCVKVIAPRG
ncbi:hypothetical protein D3C72_1356150 [compost metagenome]